MRVIDFTDGYESAAAPTAGSIQQNSLASYASDAAYVSGKGSAAADGDAYYNTALDCLRLYQAGEWTPIWGRSVKTVTGSATELVSDGTIRLNGTGLTRTLPTAVGCKGKRFTFINIVDATGAPNTIDGAGAELIRRAATLTLAEQDQFVTIESNDVSWDVVAAG